jgi:hypothetical protein
MVVDGEHHALDGPSPDHREVAARLGLEMGIRPLEEGRYFILFPLQHTLRLPPQSDSQPPTQPLAAGPSEDSIPGSASQTSGDAISEASQQQFQDPEHQLQHSQQEDSRSQPQPQGSLEPVMQASRLEDCCVVDPYGQGALMTVGEVSELFGEDPTLVLTPVSSKELLSCLVLELMQAHWAAAHGGSAMPAASIPLTVDTALDPTKVPRSLRAHAAERLVAAAEKRMWLLPNDRYGVLLKGSPFDFLHTMSLTLSQMMIGSCKAHAVRLCSHNNMPLRPTAA